MSKHLQLVQSIIDNKQDTFLSLSLTHTHTHKTPSTIKDLLTSNGLQKYTSALVDNGFDDIRYVKDISNDDLVEIGVIDERDRAKVRDYQYYSDLG